MPDPLTPEEAAAVDAVRDWVGARPDDTTVLAALARFPGRQRTLLAARAILRRRRADMVSAPSSWGIDGDYRESRSADQLKELTATLARLGDLLGDPEPVGAVLSQAPIVGPGMPR